MEKRELKLVKQVQDDARKSLRKYLHINCVVTTEEFQAPACLLDLSTGGAFIQCSEAISPDMEITLKLETSAQNTITELCIQAVVIHTGRFVLGYDNFSGFGVRFKNLSVDARHKLMDILIAGHMQQERKYLLY